MTRSVLKAVRLTPTEAEALATISEIRRTTESDVLRSGLVWEMAQLDPEKHAEAVLSVGAEGGK